MVLKSNRAALWGLFSLLTLAPFNLPSTSHCNYTFYIDADFTTARSSSLSIKQGITTALGEVNHRLFNCIFNLVEKDHRANPLQSRDNLHDYLDDPRVLLVYSGLHSPPLLSNKSFINENKILYLVPWAAAGPITRSDSDENWIFRLSIDDTKAGSFISKKAIAEGFRKPYLLLEDTGWGRSNHETMLMALKQSKVGTSGISWFKWGVSLELAKQILEKIIASGADVIFFVGNAPEGETFIRAAAALGKAFNTPIRSHWGITGGDFYNSETAEVINNLDLQFIQTRFSFLSSVMTLSSLQILNHAIKYNSSIRNAEDIATQTGFVHAYDLTKILLAAIRQTGLTGNKQQDKAAIHYALENLYATPQGLLKSYYKPFSANTPTELDGHEALSERDFAMGKYNSSGNIVLVDTKSR